MNVVGIGVVFARGRGLDALDTALRQGWNPPVPGNTSQNSTLVAAYRVPEEAFLDKSTPRRVRRADRFSKIALAAAQDAVRDSGLNVGMASESIGLILATAFGPHVTTTRFLDETLDFGEGLGSPTLFSNSLHNAAAAYIAASLGLHGPTLTITRFMFAFHEAVTIAEGWIAEGRCSHVIVGTADECGALMEYACTQKMAIAQDGKIRPFSFSSSPPAVPGEGSAFLVVTRNTVGRRYCRVFASPQETSWSADPPDLLVLDADGAAGDESRYLDLVKPATPVAAYSPLFGSILTGSSIHAAIAAQMLRGQVCYRSPIEDNPHGLRFGIGGDHRALRAINCVRLDCTGRSRTLRLRA